MSIFEFTTVAVSLILGLGVAFLLEAMVAAFRRRRTCRLDWPPFAWAAFLLVQQFQFWWALYEINAMPGISIGIFIMLLYLSGILFLAGALLFPRDEGDYPEDLGKYFTNDGSWGAAAIGLFDFSAIAANVLVFEASVVDPVNLALLVLGIMALAVAITRARTWQVAFTLLYATLLLVNTVVASPPAYESSTGATAPIHGTTGRV